MNVFYRCLLIGILISALPIGALSASAAESYAVVPSAFATTPGGGAQRPFEYDSTRFLYIYNASELIRAMPEGGIITAIAFRADELVQSSLTADIPSLEIRLSTALTTAQTISSRFAANIAPDATIVLPLGSLHLERNPSNLVPRPFDINIPLTRPFAYDPRNGGLALDILTFRGSLFGPLVDGDSGGATSSSMVGNVTAETGSIFGGSVIVQLQFQAIPEPISGAMLLLGAIVLLAKKESK